MDGVDVGGGEKKTGHFFERHKRITPYPCRTWTKPGICQGKEGLLDKCTFNNEHFSKKIRSFFLLDSLKYFK